MSSRHKWQLGLAVTLVAVGICVFFFLRGPSHGARPVGPTRANAPEFKLTHVHDPALDTPPSAPAGYVGPTVCAECHRERHAAVSLTNHFRTARSPQANDMPKAFSVNSAVFKPQYDDLRFEMQVSSGKFTQTVVKSGEGVGEQRITSTIDMVYGAGTTDDVYFHWDDQGHLSELPVGWLWHSSEWGIGSIDVHAAGNMSRPTSRRCLECHTTTGYHYPGTRNRYDRSSLILGVTCEACHGPGRQHVTFHRANPDAETTQGIVHPGELSRERQLDVCLRCHSNATKSLTPAYSFRPGDDLAKHYMVEQIHRQEDDRVANQISYLRESKCFQQSKMTCISCHDPHHKDTGESASRSCLSCHQPERCVERPRLPVAVRDDCTGCHMPKYVKINVNFGTKDDLFVPPMLRTQHKIGIHPQARELLLSQHYGKYGDESLKAKAEEFKSRNIKAYQDKAAKMAANYRYVAAVAAIREAKRWAPSAETEATLTRQIKEFAAQKRKILSLWSDAMQHIGKGENQQTIEPLRLILRLNPNDAKAHGRLGTWLATTGNPVGARKHLVEAARLDPEDGHGFAMQGWLAYLDGHFRTAIQHYESAIKVEPYVAKLQVQAGMAFRADGQLANAERHLRKALEINPLSELACRELVLTLVARSKFEESLFYSHRWVRLTNELDVGALMMLAEVSSRANRGKQALIAAQLALRVARTQQIPPAQVLQIEQRIAQYEGRNLNTTLPQD